MSSSSAPSSHPLQETIAAQSSAGWETLWQASTTPWDRGQPNPYLVQLLERTIVPHLLTRLQDRVGQRGRGIVGGCGRGYDVEAIARRTGWDCRGVDLSQTAVGEAKKWYASLPTQETPADGLKSGEVSYHAVDFFEFDLPKGAFDFAFDNTFLCALPPTLRSKWAARYLEVLPTPGSLLVTLVFPIQPPAVRAEGKGPPWAVTVEDYVELLEGKGWKKVYEGEGGDKGRLCVWERV